MEKFRDIQYIDHGRFATVLKAVEKETHRVVALKKLWIKSKIVNSASKSERKNTNINIGDNESILNGKVSFAATYNDYLSNCAQREIIILKKFCNHPNIIQLLDTFGIDEYAVLVLEYMEIDLHNLMQYYSLVNTIYI